MNKRQSFGVLILVVILSLSLSSCKVQLVVNGLEFETGKATIKSSALPQLDKVANSMGTKKYKIEVNGYSDSTGSAEANKKLSEQRAVAVKDYLVKKGIKSERVVTNGFGSESPIADNKTEEGRKKNRRTEIVVPTLKAGKFKKNGLVTRKSYLIIE